MRASTLVSGLLAAAALAAGGSAEAITLFTPIDQPTLDAFGTATFGATTTDVGPFSHSFAFTTSGTNVASASVVTIELPTGAKDIDFSSVFLDGFAFTQTGFDPAAETWGLASATIGAGLHHIFLNGAVVTAGPGLDAASYSGTLNIAPTSVPEPAGWALMIGGFGLAGAALRRSRKLAA